MSGLTYKGAGVDIARKEDAIARVRDRIGKTKRPEVLGGIGAFGGLFKLGSYRDAVLVATTDGVGTKLDIARELNRHETIGADLVNHCVNDALAMGAEPLFFLDYFSTTRLDPDVFARVVGGMADACAAQGCALLGGETAQMPGMYADGVYDIAGFLVGAVERDELLDPANVQLGDALIGLPSSGLHTNGYSLARMVVERAGLDVGQPLPELRGGTLGDALLAPHTSYLADVRELRSVARVRSIAHLTGGGWEGNLPRALPAEFGAAVDRGAWTIPPLFTLLGNAGAVSIEERFNTWNMGIGLIAVISSDDERAALRRLPNAISLGRVEQASGEQRVRWI